MAESIQGQFRADSNGANIIDINAGNQVWSHGASLIDIIPVRPPLVEPWTILSWSINFQGVITGGGTVPGYYGKLPNLLGGLVRDASGQTAWAAGGVPYIPQTQFPGDTSMIDTIFDGGQDPAFPMSDPTLPAFVSHNFSLPQPLKLLSGENVGIGLWLTPSLLTNSGGVLVYAARWSVTVDIQT